MSKVLDMYTEKSKELTKSFFYYYFIAFLLFLIIFQLLMMNVNIFFTIPMCFGINYYISKSFAIFPSLVKISLVRIKLEKEEQ